MKCKFVVCIALFLGVLFSLKAQTKERPNIIVILADDIGVGDISKYRRLHSNNIILETPNIDKLAEKGMMFTDAHSPAALCATSRYAIMTGNSNFRSTAPWGIWSGYAKSVIRKNQMTLGKLMKKANYNTAFFGKWHIGTSFPRKDNPNEIYIDKNGKVDFDVDISRIISGPKQLGFDYSLSLPAGIQGPPYAFYENHKWMKLKPDSKIQMIDDEFMKKINSKLDKNPGYGDSNWDPHNVGGILAKKAANFIAKNAKKENPFFMYYCSQAVHVPHAPIKNLAGKKVRGTTPSFHLDMVKELDIQMGILIDELKKQGVFENTVFIFTSDNGGLLKPKTKKSGHKVSSIYRGSKNKSHEGGHRVPFIVSWPNKIKKGKVNETPILGQDIMATIAAISDQKLTKDVAQDSYNLLPILTNKEKKHKRDFIIVQGGSGHDGIIIEDGWKLILNISKKDKSNNTRIPIALFDLNTNITEKEEFNLINSEKHQVKLKYLFDKYNKTRDSNTPTSVH